ncbi:MAG: hypothetical protein A2Y80_02860 [Deltaproteobacteria bacterium RBG_13_58_19]|nr:MAG: hypothetical protein A2Y80_02860 [Deltaproteobacteria bacterium RBG_13_58_19]
MGRNIVFGTINRTAQASTNGNQFQLGAQTSLAAGGSTINFRTDKTGQDVDLPAKVTQNLVANVGYTAEVGRDKSSNMGVNLGLCYKF